ncbi:MAG: hypothetical protein Q8P23_01030 [bacterium]|nr:hypothetical protein [bacterium]
MTLELPVSCARNIVEVYIDLLQAEEQISDVRRAVEIEQDSEIGAGSTQDRIEQIVRKTARSKKVNFEKAKELVERAINTIQAIGSSGCVTGNVLNTTKAQAERALRSIVIDMPENTPLADVIHTLKITRAEYRAHL